MNIELEQEYWYREQAIEIAEILRGTSQTLMDYLESVGKERFESVPAFCEQLDAVVFKCETCSWWHEQSERVEDDWVCIDCEAEE